MMGDAEDHVNAETDYISAREEHVRAENNYLSVRGLSQFEDRLADWENLENDTDDQVHCHFEAVEKSFVDCWGVALEGRRLWYLMFDQRIETDSAMAAVLDGIAASAYALAIRDVAKKLGVSELAVRVGIESSQDGCGSAFALNCMHAHEERSK